LTSISAIEKHRIYLSLIKYRDIRKVSLMMFHERVGVCMFFSLKSSPIA
jgi:hypothetical protein